MIVPHLHTKRQVETGGIQEPVFSLKPSGQHQKDLTSIYFARKLNLHVRFIIDFLFKVQLNFLDLLNPYKTLYISASEFEDKFEGRVCANGIDIYPTEPYSTLKQAKVACSNDQNCGKVVNFGCDGRRFHLCKKGSQIKFSDHGSCIYNHNREHGKNDKYLK